MSDTDHTESLIGRRLAWAVVGALLVAMLMLSGDAQARYAPVDVDARGTLQQRLFRDMLMSGIYAYRRGDYATAAMVLRPLSDAGIPDAQFHLALLHDRGTGVVQHVGEAVRLYTRAATQGHHGAQYNLGVAYAKGEGVPRDIHKAVDWWRRAALQGNRDAQFNLGVVYIRGGDIPRDAREAVHWWRMAALQGDPAAQYNLGAIYVRGDGVEPDISEAARWWRKSAAQGYRQAVAALRALMAVLSGTHQVQR
ncbi:MAG: sel1 repeat family protein [Gammaproteobacteria bacterium]|nr:sel1 repeat family protein [Gammaproteobacteria bacterium]NIY31683.1 hypothetical protein [Gammaproteobacteria bacterium]